LLLRSRSRHSRDSFDIFSITFRSYKEVISQEGGDYDGNAYTYYDEIIYYSESCVSSSKILSLVFWRALWRIDGFDVVGNSAVISTYDYCYYRVIWLVNYSWLVVALLSSLEYPYYVKQLLSVERNNSDIFWETSSDWKHFIFVRKHSLKLKGKIPSYWAWFLSISLELIKVCAGITSRIWLRFEYAL